MGVGCGVRVGVLEGNTLEQHGAAVVATKVDALCYLPLRAREGGERCGDGVVLGGMPVGVTGWQWRDRAIPPAPLHSPLSLSPFLPRQPSTILPLPHTFPHSSTHNHRPPTPALTPASPSRFLSSVLLSRTFPRAMEGKSLPSPLLSSHCHSHTPYLPAPPPPPLAMLKAPPSRSPFPVRWRERRRRGRSRRRA
jgi:hypothetical protein